MSSVFETDLAIKYTDTCFNSLRLSDAYGSSHEGAAVLLPGFAIIWYQNQVTRQPHLGDLTHIRIGKLIIIGPGNGLSPGRHQAIILTNAGILLIGPLGRNFSEISIEIYTFSFKKMHLKMSIARWRPFCLGLTVLNILCVVCSTASLAGHYWWIGWGGGEFLPS